MHIRKILFLIGDYSTGGKERQLTEIIRNLPKEKYEIYLFMKNENSYYFGTIKENLTSYCSLGKENFSFTDILALRQYNKSIQPHIVFSFSTTLSHYSLLLKLLGIFKYRLINGSIRDAPVNLNLHMLSEKLLYNFYEEVVANSKAGLQAYNQNGKRGRHVLYNGIDENRIPKISKDELRQQLRIDERFMVVMVASMGESKDQTTFLKAAAKVLEITDDIQFYLVGDGPKKSEYMNLVLTLELENNIYFTGEVSNAEQYLKASDLSVLMSTNAEGFPNVVLESLACRTPVVANDNGGTRELLINGKNGYLVRPGDHEMLASKIRFMNENKNVLHRLAENGAYRVREKFGMNKMVSNFEDILNKGIAST